MESEPSTLMWSLIGLSAVLLLMVVFIGAKLAAINREYRALTKTLDKVEARLSEQERRLAEVQRALESRGGDVFSPFIEMFGRLKSKGVLSALTLLGSFLFRSYLSKKRQKSLPDKSDT